MARTAKGTGLDNRRKILEAAAAIIGKKGIEKTSLAQIAAASKVSKGTLYYYYATKDELIFDLADQHITAMTSALFEMMEENKALSLSDLLQAFFSTLLASDARSRLHLYLVREAVSGNTVLKKRFQATYETWFEMVAQAYEKLGKSSAHIRSRAKFLVAVADGFVLQGLLEVEETGVEKIVDLMAGVLEDV